jgi:hypothetical protein
VQQYGRGQAARAVPQQAQQRARPRGPGRHARDRKDPHATAGGEPVDLQRLDCRTNVPQAEHRAAHGGGRGPGQHPAQRGLKHPAERDLLPGDGADRDAQQHLIGELPPVQPGDPLVVEQGPGGRDQRTQPERGHHRHGRRRSQPEPGPQPIPPQAKIVRGQPVGRRDAQHHPGGQGIDRRIPPPVPGLGSHQVVVASQRGAGRRGEGHIG